MDGPWGAGREGGGENRRILVATRAVRQNDAGLGRHQQELDGGGEGAGGEGAHW